MSFNFVPDFMWVTDSARSRLPLVEIAGQAVENGVDLIHIREKSMPRDQLRALGRQLAEIGGDRAKVVLNADVELAVDLEVGVHFPEGMTIPQRLHVTQLRGRSVHSPEAAAGTVGVDYLVAGHVYETGSKSGKQPLGLSGLASIVERTILPVLAIGGVTPENVEAILSTGAHGIAVMSGIGSASNPGTATLAYRAAIDRFKSHQLGESPMAIHLTVNGKAVDLERPMSIQSFLDGRKLHPNMVVVEHNGVILRKSQFTEIELASGDVLEVVHFVGGG